jgi:ABC-type branched-subunit amino acid transport system ATPase component
MITIAADSDSRADHVLEIKSVSKSFGGVRAVHDVSFKIARGEITGLIGPNGAGKSTLLSLIAGTDRPDTGSILYGHENIAGARPHHIAELGLIRTFQISSEFGHMSVLENMLIGAKEQLGAGLTGAIRGKHYWARNEAQLVQRSRGLLDRFGIRHAENQYASTLSGGQKRLLEIARALMAEPAVLLLDEPFAGINPTLARSVEEHLILLRDEGLTMLMVEHELGAVDRCTNSVVVMANGALLATGSMAELRENEEVRSAYLVG